MKIKLSNCLCGARAVSRFQAVVDIHYDLSRKEYMVATIRCSNNCYRIPALIQKVDQNSSLNQVIWHFEKLAREWQTYSNQGLMARARNFFGKEFRAKP